MPPRSTKIRHDDNTRAKIQVAMIMDRLQKCIDGQLELSPVQVSAAKILLSKALPDLQSTTITADVAVTTQTQEQRDAAVAAALQADR